MFPITIQFANGIERTIFESDQMPTGVPFTILKTGVSDVEEKTVVDSGYAFMVMDRSSCAMSSFEDLIHTSPFIEQFPELDLYANVVLEYLMKIYQVSASLCFDWDEEENKTKTFDEMMVGPGTIAMLKQEDECSAFAMTLSISEAQTICRILESEITERSCRSDVVKLHERFVRYKTVMERI